MGYSRMWQVVMDNAVSHFVLAGMIWGGMNEPILCLLPACREEMVPVFNFVFIKTIKDHYSNESGET
jgi:hypothetical protein